MPHQKSDLNLSMKTNKALPRRIADLLLSKIFSGELKPGDKLPPDRLLAEQLGVDRTSLRAALSELAGRNLVKAVQGSGVVVLDYREHAGLDFLDAVLDISDVDLGGALKLEFLNHWIDVMPEIIKMAIHRSTPADFAAIDGLIDQLSNLQAKDADLYALASVEVEMEDILVNIAGSTILKLLTNSMRKVRVQFVASFYKYIDINAHILYLRDVVHHVLDNSMPPEAIAEQFRSYLQENTRVLRERIARTSQQPSRLNADSPQLERNRQEKGSAFLQ